MATAAAPQFFGVRYAHGGVRGDVAVLSSKLHPPAGRPGSVARRDLLARLNESVSAKLVVVAAPAGWGKTSLLRDWCSAGERLAAPVTLVLGDYHLISNPSLLECVAYLVEHLPATLRLVVSARSDPVLPLARLRARGEMTEIRAEELRFTDDEAAELLNGTLGLALAQEDIDALQRRTEGWAAGLYLASLSLCGRPDPSRLVRAFAGDDRQVVDYLVAEVLDAPPADVRSFIMRMITAAGLPPRPARRPVGWVGLGGEADRGTGGRDER